MAKTYITNTEIGLFFNINSADELRALGYISEVQARNKIDELLVENKVKYIRNKFTVRQKLCEQYCEELFKYIDSVFLKLPDGKELGFFFAEKDVNRFIDFKNKSESKKKENVLIFSDDYVTTKTVKDIIFKMFCYDTYEFGGLEKLERIFKQLDRVVPKVKRGTGKATRYYYKTEAVSEFLRKYSAE